MRLQLPILMLTARREVVDKVVGLKLGADDYLTKPFDMMELLARVEALLRRSRVPVATSEGTFSFGDVLVDFAAGEACRAGHAVALSALDFKLLKYFIENRGETLTRDRLLDEGEAVQVLQLGARAERGAGRPQRQVHVAAERALLHVRVGDAEPAHGVAHRSPPRLQIRRLNGLRPAPPIKCQKQRK